jgi:hypothetical protein
MKTEDKIKFLILDFRVHVTALQKSSVLPIGKLYKSYKDFCDEFYLHLSLLIDVQLCFSPIFP